MTSLAYLRPPLTLPLTLTHAPVQPLAATLPPTSTQAGALGRAQALTPYPAPPPAFARASALPIPLTLTLALTLLIALTPTPGRNGRFGCFWSAAPFPPTLPLASAPNLAQALDVLLALALTLTLPTTLGLTLGPSGPGCPR